MFDSFTNNKKQVKYSVFPEEDELQKCCAAVLISEQEHLVDSSIPRL